MNTRKIEMLIREVYLNMSYIWFLLIFLSISEAGGVRFLRWQIVVNLALPPPIRLRFPGGESKLRADCEAEAASSSNFVWAGDVTKGYQIATVLFKTIENQQFHLKNTRTKAETSIWFPYFSGEIEILRELARVVNENSHRLGNDVSALAVAWPQSPCSMLRLSWKPLAPISHEFLIVEDDIQKVESAVAETKQWVDKILCKLKLCPYTISLSRAAVGLESANVSPGPVRVHHCSKNILCKGYPMFFSAAAVLSRSFWEGVTELASISEEDVATSLLIAPSVYDMDFREFVATCDELIEPSLQAVGADDIVGRAWFHPCYNSTDVGHTTILPGHAIPTAIVQGFIHEQIKDRERLQNLNLEDVQRGNDAVRWTPHATINLLRRSQLKIAKKVESKLLNSRPNAIYVRNVFAMLARETEKDKKKKKI